MIHGEDRLTVLIENRLERMRRPESLAGFITKVGFVISAPV
ncbi:hypothetical protein [Streptosporangium sp. 'caverna']|nr:hypothetical protein [Streptosporangium sp. 'caverna']